jgi:23S rRNA pseudouridine1911/1915/1917 synthase
VVAKSAGVAGELGKLLASSNVTKIYDAIVHGHVEGDALLVDAPLGKDDASVVAIKDCVRVDGAPARTRVRVIGRLERDGRPLTHLEVSPETGRKHQIRIHLAHIGHPIAGDKIYGGDERRYLRFVEGALTAEDRDALILENHALHARALGFRWRDRDWQFDAPLRPDFSAMLITCRT